MKGSRLRHLLALLLCLVSLWATLHFSRIYTSHRLWLGLCATTVLGLLLIGGALSFMVAQRRLLRERLVLLPGAGEPPPDSLAGRRRTQLLALRSRGGRPDVAVLAQSAAAEVGHQAYLGRYFVAVAVLVGLLGTFAGLMETLGGVSNLLQKDMGQNLQSMQSVLLSLSAPLSGLDVTFGASMVGILVTVTLSMLQGDLGLLDEELLAALEEHTAHVLIPSLWPADREPAAQLCASLSALRGELSQAVVRIEDVHRSSLSEHVSRSAAQIQHFASEIAEQLLAHAGGTAEVLSRHAAEGASQLDTRLRQSNEALLAHARRTTTGVEQMVQKLVEAEEARTRQRDEETLALSRRLTQEVRESVAGLCRAVAQGTEQAAQASAEASMSTTRVAAQAQEQLLLVTGEAVTHTRQAAEQAGAQAVQLMERVSADLSRYARALEVAEQQRTLSLQQAEGRRLADHEELRGRLESFLERGIEKPMAQHLSAWQEAARTAAESSRRAEQSATALAQAAQHFSLGSEALVPLLETLSPELHALSAEVALLAERSEGQLSSSQPQLLAELMRLTESIERLERRLLERDEARHAPPLPAVG